MFAVIKTGGKQHRVVADQTLKVYLHDAKVGEIVTFPVIAHGGDTPKFGTPLIDGASVAAEVLAQTHGRTILAFKKRRRQNSKRKRGYRDQYTLVRVTEILLDARSPPRPRARSRKRRRIRKPPKAKRPLRKSPPPRSPPRKSPPPRPKRLRKRSKT